MKRALISVSDKTDIVQFAQGLVKNGYNIISTGGTRKVLTDNNIPTTSIEEVTGFPEILNGRVKTLHPLVHGGLLALRNNDQHIAEVDKNKIEYIDLVCVNLYPFKETVKVIDTTFEQAIEQIDIGGPSMIRSAAKNFQFVTVVTNQSDYKRVLNEINISGDTSLELKKELSAKAFRLTAAYDAYISNYLTKSCNTINPESLTMTYEFSQEMRYGENPHQQASFYKASDSPYSLLNAEILNGKPLSYNNIQDANAAINILKEYTNPTAVALKHMNPCGIGSSNNIIDAFKLAYASDSVSIFGGIVSLNEEVSEELAIELNKIFLEIIIAPSYSENALKVLQKKKNLRVLKLNTSLKNTDNFQVVSVNGGLLVQECDNYLVPIKELKTVTLKQPTTKDLEELLFAWKAVKHVKSNAIVISSGTSTVGIGAGQMNRVGAASIALESAKKNGHTENLTLSSDAFLPFDDVVKLAHSYGVNKIIQPGGSIRDNDSIKVCDDLGIIMVFTNHRHFKH